MGEGVEGSNRLNILEEHRVHVHRRMFAMNNKRIVRHLTGMKVGYRQAENA